MKEDWSMLLKGEKNSTILIVACAASGTQCHILMPMLLISYRSFMQSSYFTDEEVFWELLRDLHGRMNVREKCINSKIWNNFSNSPDSCCFHPPEISFSSEVIFLRWVTVVMKIMDAFCFMVSLQKSGKLSQVGEKSLNPDCTAEVSETLYDMGKRVLYINDCLSPYILQGKFIYFSWGWNRSFLVQRLYLQKPFLA